MAQDIDATPEDFIAAFRAALRNDKCEVGPNIITTKEWAELEGIGKTRANQAIRQAINVGTIEKVWTKRNGKTVPGYKLVGDIEDLPKDYGNGKGAD
jgi:hypothetical protein